jgi:hypothetical protein
MKKGFLVAAGVLAFAGCTPSYVEDNSSTVLFKIADVNGGAALDSDVFNATTGTVRDLAPVTLAVRSKNPRITTVPQVAMAVFVERYEISYYRSDGRGVEGVDVPYRISGNLSTAVDVGTGSGQNVTVSLEVVRLQAKLEPPLLNLRGGGQAQVLSCFAQITIHGKTVAGEAVESTGTLQINFADYADK